MFYHATKASFLRTCRPIHQLNQGLKNVYAINVSTYYNLNVIHLTTPIRPFQGIAGESLNISCTL